MGLVLCWPWQLLLGVNIDSLTCQALGSRRKVGDAKLGSLGSAFASVSVFLVSLNQQPPTFLAPGTNFVEENFSTDLG